MGVEDKIKELIKEEIEKAGYILENVQLNQRQRAKEVLVTINKKGKRISISDCVFVSKLIEPILEKADLIKKRYYLVVSSPGIK